MRNSKPKKIYILAPYALGWAPSQRFRWEQYLDYLDVKGFEYTVSCFFSEQAYKILYTKGNFLRKIVYVLIGFVQRIMDLFAIPRADFVFIHREAAPIGPPVFEWIIARCFRKKIIFDFDDAIWLPNTSVENHWVAQLKFHKKTSTICKIAHSVSAGNAYLAHYARNFNKNVHVIPTSIASNTLKYCEKNIRKINSPAEPVVIGWIGSHSTLPYLAIIEKDLLHMALNYAVKIVIVCNTSYPFTFEHVFVEWNKNTEIQDIISFDIGLMPLPDTEWAKGKCGFKALQYMSLGVPVVASDVGANREIIRNCTDGYLIPANASWIEALTALVKDAVLRRTMGANGKQRVFEKYTNEVLKDKFLQLFE